MDKCARASCQCKIGDKAVVGPNGQLFCSQTCVNQCTDEKCVCEGCSG